jgi:outer membrane protein TolC
MRNWEKKGKKAARLPSLVAFGAYDVDAKDPDLDSYFDSFEAGVALSWKLDPAVGPRIRQAQAKLRRERENLRVLLLDAAKEVRLAWDRLQVAKSQLALAGEGAKTAVEAWRLISSSYDNGSATLTDLLEAVNARKTARTRKSAAEAAVRIAKLRLIGAMGGVK